MKTKQKARGPVPMFYRWAYFPLVCTGGLMLAMHLFLPTDLVDDAYYRTQLGEMGIGPLVAMRYETWSPRVLSDFFDFVLLSMSPVVWRFLDTGVMVLLLFAASRLVGGEQPLRQNWFLCALWLLLPFEDLSGAGWVTTTLNYLWPLAFGLLALLPLAKTARGETMRMAEYPIYIFATLFAANVEQMCIALLALYLVFILGRLVARRKIPPLLLALPALLAGCLVFILTSPGLRLRGAAEVSRYFPNFETLAFAQKVQLGIWATAQNLLLRQGLLLPVFCVLLACGVWLARRELSWRVIGLLPLCLFAFFQLWGQFSQWETGLYGPVNVRSVTGPGAYLPLVLAIAFFLLLPLCLYGLHGHTWRALGQVALLLAGLGSALLIGFSPTVWASGYRTGWFLWGMILLSGAFIYRVLLESRPKLVTGIDLPVMGAAACVGVLRLVIALFL